MKEWSVSLQTSHALGNDQLRLEAYADDLVEVLNPRAGVVGYDALMFSARFNVKAPAADAALTKALRVFAAALKRIRFPDPLRVVSAEVETVEELDRRLQESNVPELVGVAEVAGILGVTKQRASELSHSRRFPKPIVQLAAGPVWDRHAIARFVETWPRRRTGRPKKAVAIAR